MKSHEFVRMWRWLYEVIRTGMDYAVLVVKYIIRVMLIRVIGLWVSPNPAREGLCLGIVQIPRHDHAVNWLLIGASKGPHPHNIRTLNKGCK